MRSISSGVWSAAMRASSVAFSACTASSLRWLASNDCFWLSHARVGTMSSDATLPATASAPASHNRPRPRRLRGRSGSFSPSRSSVSSAAATDARALDDDRDAPTTPTRVGRLRSGGRLFSSRSHGRGPCGRGRRHLRQARLLCGAAGCTWQRGHCGKVHPS
jgi:hypothetical protein